jgi:hypothetical protein
MSSCNSPDFSKNEKLAICQPEFLVQTLSQKCELKHLQLLVQGVWGFILGGLTWFAIPFTLATTMGLAYLGLSSSQARLCLLFEPIRL